MPDEKYELLREMMEIRGDVLDGVKRGILDADTRWAQQNAGEAANWDRCYAQLGLFGAVVGIVGTVVAATPPGLAVGAGVVAVIRIQAMVSRVKGLSMLADVNQGVNVGAAVGGTIQAAGAGVGLWATYYAGMGKPNFVVKKNDLDQLSSRLTEHLDILQGKLKTHWGEFQTVRDKLVTDWSKNPRYKAGFGGGGDGDAHDIRMQLILDKLYKNLGNYDAGVDGFKNGIAMSVSGKCIDLYEVIQQFLPEFRKNAPPPSLSGGFPGPTGYMTSPLPAVKQTPNPKYSAYMTADNFLQTFMKTNDYKRWKLRSRVSQIPGMESFLR